jgi:hypothetical protein
MIGFIILAHHGEKRPLGQNLLNNVCKSVQHCKQPYYLIVIDHGSEQPMSLPNNVSECIRIENQFLGGFPLAINSGIKAAFESDCTLIHVINDDVTLNYSINDYNQAILKYPKKDISIFGPTGSRVSGKQNRGGRSNRPRIVEVDAINGFFMTFTKQFCERFHVGELNYEMFGKEPKWGRVEHDAFQIPAKKNGAIVHIVEQGWFKHKAIGGWRKTAREAAK